MRWCCSSSGSSSCWPASPIRSRWPPPAPARWRCGACSLPWCWRTCPRAAHRCGPPRAWPARRRCWARRSWWRCSCCFPASARCGACPATRPSAAPACQAPCVRARSPSSPPTNRSPCGYASTVRRRRPRRCISGGRCWAPSTAGPGRAVPVNGAPRQRWPPTRRRGVTSSCWSPEGWPCCRCSRPRSSRRRSSLQAPSA